MNDPSRLERQSAFRRRVVLGAFAALGAGLLFRAVQLQALEHEFYLGEGHARQLRTVEIPAHRGRLTDRNGEPLAISTPIQTITAEPMKLVEQPDAIGEIASLIGVEADPLRKRVERAASQGRRFMYVKRHVPPDVVERVIWLGVNGISLRREYRRYFPSGPATAHLVGFTDIDDRGTEGLELAYDNWLRGSPGSRRVVRDIRGREITGLDVLEAAQPGRDLKLSVDEQLQYVASRALIDAIREHDASSASAVVLDVRSGEVLAMSNVPSYNPNDSRSRHFDRQRNRAVTDVFEPGSTMKPFTIAAALASGKFVPDDIVDTSPGSYYIGKYEIRDAKDNGWLDLRGIVRQSSNVGISKIARQLDPEQMWSVFDAFGFGRSPGSQFPGEVAGYFNHPSYWHRVEQESVSFGYGLSVTALQLARAYAALGNDGVMMPVSFLAIDSAEDELPEGTRVIDQSIVAEVDSMLESVVTHGSGTRAKVPGYQVAGKTGTSHRSEKGGYAEDRYVSVFAGFAPASDPRIATVVVVHDPKGGDYFGSQVAAPVFADIMAQALRLQNVDPDDTDELRERLPAFWNDMARVDQPDDES